MGQGQAGGGVDGGAAALVVELHGGPAGEAVLHHPQGSVPDFLRVCMATSMVIAGTSAGNVRGAGWQCSSSSQGLTGQHGHGQGQPTWTGEVRGRPLMAYLQKSMMATNILRL